MAVMRGDFGALEDLQRRIREVTNPKFKEEVAHRLAGTAIKLLADEFRQSRDPYGVGWKPVNRNRARDRRARGRRDAGGRFRRADKPLVDTGRLRAAATAATDSSVGGTVRIVIPVEYASYHQDGTRRMVRRQIVPDRAGGLGPIWGAAFRKTIEQKLAEAVVRR
jgi:hypothetical protein